MQISIAERLRPFCHLPGTAFILPGIGYQVQIFPCLIRIYDLKQASPMLLAELAIEIKGPVEQFTVCNDLERGRLIVFGRTPAGWMRYYLISAQTEGIRLVVEKAPSHMLCITHEQECHLVYEKKWLDLLGSSPFQPYTIPPCDRLSFGNHKVQDWELVSRRFDLKEIFPFLHRLGQLIPSQELPSINAGTLALLEECRKSFQQNKPEQAQQHWLNFIRGGFRPVLIPQLQDMHYQGIAPGFPSEKTDISPLVLLSEGAHLIRHLFVQQEKEHLLILPFLLPCFPHGRLLHVPLEGGMLSLEWTKKTIRRLIFYVEHEQEWVLHFRSHVRSYRLRRHSKDKGERRNCSLPLFLKKNCHYFFDNFQ